MLVTPQNCLKEMGLPAVLTARSGGLFCSIEVLKAGNVIRPSFSDPGHRNHFNHNICAKEVSAYQAKVPLKPANQEGGQSVVPR